MRPLSRVAVAAVIGMAWPSEGRAALPEAYGFGSRAAALAGAVSADSSDFSAVAYNPAGLAGAKGLSIGAGYTANFHELSTNGADNDVADARGVVAGVVAPGRVGGLPVALGVALHLPDKGLSYIKSRRQEAPRWELYDTRQQLLFLAAALAARPWPWLEVGAGLGFLSATRGSFSLRGTAELARPFDSQLEHAVDADLTAVRFPLIGVRLSRPGWGSVALSYRGESKLDLQIDARLDGQLSIAGISVPFLYELEAQTMSAFSPRTLTASWSLRRIEGLHVNLDLSWVEWSAYESPVARVRALLDVDLPAGAPIALPPSPRPTEPLPPMFRDRIVPRVGMEWRPSFGTGGMSSTTKSSVELPLRAGYAFERSPVPPQRGATTFIDADRHTVSIGLGVAVRDPFEALRGTVKLDVHGMLAVLPETATNKSRPVDLTGDFVARGTILGVGATTEVAF